MTRSTIQARTARPAIILAAVALPLSIALCAGIGPDADTGLNTLTVLGTLLSSLPALAYTLAAIGLGRLAAPLYRPATDRFAIQCAAGLAVMLSLSHLLGWSGVFGTSASRAAAILPVALGLALGGEQLVRTLRGRTARGTPAVGLTLDPLLLLLVPGAGLLLVAACQPPGWLWSTEFGAYDALEYHLQLPQEWLAAGRLMPVDHNVYSYLPGYVESAFLHLAVVMGLPRAPAPEGIGFGLTAHGAAGALACQVLHALITVLAAVITGRLGAGLARSGADPSDDARPASLAFAVSAGLVLLTPWTVVVGSLAYNELAVLALLAGALVIAFDHAIPASRRGALCALCVGVACGAKPTALMFAGLPVGIALLGSLPPRRWPAAVLAGIPVGLLALAPWLVRNSIACANPVFPFAHRLFGPSHWSEDQFDRYQAAHSVRATLVERLGLMVLEEPLLAGERAAGPSRHRGTMHPQYFAFFPLCLAAALSSLRWLSRSAAALERHAVRPAVLLTAGLLAQSAAWLFATHLQSRFLLPLLVPGAVLIGLQLAQLSRSSVARAGVTVARACAVVALAAQVAATIFIFSVERARHPNRLLPVGPGFFTGQLIAEELSDPGARAEALDGAPVEAAINIMLSGPGSPFPPGSVYLLGDATPFYYSVPVVYHTTYDRSPLGEAMRRAPSDPDLWTRDLLARGIRYVLYAPGEIRRLRASGWYDPTVTPDAAERWLARSATPLRAWEHQGRVLFQLRDPSAVEPGR